MPPRGSNERLDFTPILTHYLFLFTTIFAVVSILPGTAKTVLARQCRHASSPASNIHRMAYDQQRQGIFIFAFLY
jgi:hypothetical protein